MSLSQKRNNPQKVNATMTLMTVKEYAEYRGVSPQAVNKAIKNQRISYELKNGRRHVDRDKADAEWAQKTDASRQVAAGAPVTPTGKADPSVSGRDDGGAMTELNRERLRQMTIKADREEFEFNVRKGQFVEKSDVRDVIFKRARQERDRYLTLATRYGPELADVFGCEARLVIAELERVTRELVGEMSEEKLSVIPDD